MMERWQEMSLYARHFPIVAPRAAINQDGGIKIRKTQILIKPTAAFSREITCRKYPNAVISRLYFHLKLTVGVFLRLPQVSPGQPADITTNGGWRCDECRKSVLGGGAGPEVGNSSFHMGHSTTYTVSTHITLMIIKDRPGKPPAMLVKEFPCTFVSLY